MRSKLVTRITIAVLVVLVLAAASSAVAVASALRNRATVREFQQILQSTRAAEELELALLEQRGVVSAYMLDDGNVQRLSDLPKAHAAFQKWRDQLKAITTSDELRDLLQELESVYEQYIALRTQVVELYQAGEKRRAPDLLLVDVNQLYAKAYGLCEKIISNDHMASTSKLSSVEAWTIWELWMVGILGVICALVTIWLLRLLFYGILKPLQQMIREAQSFQVESSGLIVRSTDDELKAIGYYFQRLMTDVVNARTTIDEHRQRLKHSESLASVGKLASCVAHEIRNPLTAINMWLFSAERALQVNSGPRDMLRKALQETRRLENVVQHFLEFARPPELSVSRADLQAIVKNSLELVHPRAFEREIKITLNIPATLKHVSADTNQVTQVISNLLINAIDASTAGQTISLWTEERQDGNSDYLVLFVNDQGPGITPTMQERIFEPFFTTKELGTGLGLCIAANIMSRHQGRVRLEHSGHNGSTFSVWIPLDQEAR